MIDNGSGWLLSAASLVLYRDMIEKRFKHLKWREKRPPILPFNSYVLLEKLEPNKKASAAPICQILPQSQRQMRHASQPKPHQQEQLSCHRPRQ